MSRNEVAAREDWYTLDKEHPRLLGSQCAACGTYFFPAQEKFCRNPECDSEQFNSVELSHKGSIWSYTSAGYPPPPPYKAPGNYEPFGLAAVQLEKEQLIVLGQLAEGISIKDVKIGDEVELVLETLFEDDENCHLVWKWKPVGGQS